MKENIPFGPIPDGTLFKAARKRLGLSKTDVAIAIGERSASITNFERHRNYPSERTKPGLLERAALVLEITPEELRLTDRETLADWLNPYTYKHKRESGIKLSEEDEVPQFLVFRAWRQNRGLSQEIVAQKIGKSKLHVSAFERGKIRVVGTDNLLRATQEAFGVSFDEIGAMDRGLLEGWLNTPLTRKPNNNNYPKEDLTDKKARVKKEPEEGPKRKAIAEPSTIKPLKVPDNAFLVQVKPEKHTKTPDPTPGALIVDTKTGKIGVFHDFIGTNGAGYMQLEILSREGNITLESPRGNFGRRYRFATPEDIENMPDIVRKQG